MTRAERVVYFPSCAARTMGPQRGDDGVEMLPVVAERLFRRAGFDVVYPAAPRRPVLRPAVREQGAGRRGEPEVDRARGGARDASEGGRWPIVFDTSPCAYRMKKVLAGRLQIQDSIEFVHDTVLARVAIAPQAQAVAVHPVCSVRKMGSVDKLLAVAAAAARAVTTSDDGAVLRLRGRPRLRPARAQRARVAPPEGRRSRPTARRAIRAAGRARSACRSRPDSRIDMASKMSSPIRRRFASLAEQTQLRPAALRRERRSRLVARRARYVGAGEGRLRHDAGHRRPSRTFAKRILPKRLIQEPRISRPKIRRPRTRRPRRKPKKRVVRSPRRPMMQTRTLPPQRSVPKKLVALPSFAARNGKRSTRGASMTRLLLSRARACRSSRVGLPPIRGARSSGDTAYLNELYRARAERAGIKYVDVWDGFVDEAGKYSNYGPDYEGQVRRLRSSDGVFLHQSWSDQARALCRTGIEPLYE